MAECDPATIEVMGAVEPAITLVAAERGARFCVMEAMGDMYSDDGGSACLGACMLAESVEREL